MSGDDSLDPEETLLATRFVARHHSITASAPLADVVVACACTPGVQRDAAGWAAHLLGAIFAIPTSGIAPESSGASVPVGEVPPVEEAGGISRVIPINRNT